MEHFANNGKEYLKQYETPGQGRTKDQYKYSLMAFAIAFIGICVIGSVLILIKILCFILQVSLSMRFRLI